MTDRAMQCRCCGCSFPDFPDMCSACAGVLRDDLAEAGWEEDESTDTDTEGGDHD